MTVEKYLACACLWLTAGLAHSEPLIAPTAIDWLLDCPLPVFDPLDPGVLERTQCGIVDVPRNYSSPRQGSVRLYVTRVGARQPLSREGVVFVQAGDAPQKNTAGTFAILLASRWSTYSNQAYRTLLNYYDVIEVSHRDLTDENGVDQSARDLEFVRAQLGDAQLHFLGTADATRVGSLYAELFPERITRLLLVNADYREARTDKVEQLRLREPDNPDASRCINQWVGDFLAYGKQPPPSTRCLDRED
ncbi:alpha/beta fold hydrolase [Pseudomonas poae]|uniref:Proteinase n=1 Tax=Pseudomonas poae TaxID=200451 RepID=A0A2S9EXH8_9PSED|nr:alpha/beta fold hydrolase [Pseudomonas poae]PRA33893.1 proteinase [Pseudomonas poae]PRC21494.1 proteinase [Pseudomonas poae]